MAGSSGFRRAESERGLRGGCRAQGAGGWCRGGLVAAWWSLGQEEDTQAGPREKELGGRERKGLGAQEPFCPLLVLSTSVCVCVWHRLCWASLPRGLPSGCVSGGCAPAVGCGLLSLRSTGSRAQARPLWPSGSAAPRHVGSARTRGRVCVTCAEGRFFTAKPPGKPSLLVFRLFGPI